jgi:anti-sigma B factor antagonist
MVKTEKKDGFTIDTFEDTDKITAINADSIKKELNGILNESNTKLVVSLHNISFVDSTGFGAFLSVMKTAHSTEGELKICDINPDIMKLFKLLHLDNVFELYKSIDDCM